MRKVNISIIIVNWNGRKWLDDCLPSIFRQTYKEFEVIVVDNNSSDNSVDFLKKNYPQVHIIQNEQNLGFGNANNLGAKFSHGKILFFLNNDTKIKQTDFFQTLLKCQEKNDYHILGPRCLNMKNEDPAKGQFLGIDPFSYPGLNKNTPFYIEGCALMITKKDFEELGGFDDKYFMYSEDIDICWRAKIMNMKMGVCENALLTHYGGGSSESTLTERNSQHRIPIFRRYEVEKNSLRNILKSYQLINLIWVVPIYISLSLLEAVFYLTVLLQPKLSMKILSALLWNIRHISDTLKKRKKVQMARKVRDLEIFKNMTWGSNKLKAFWYIGWKPKFV